VTHSPALVVALAVAGIAGGLFLLVRGLAAYRAGEAVRGTGTSRIESLAAGEVRLVGAIEAGPVTLVSPLQSAPCVYYHARILEDRGRERTATLDETRAVGFLLRDATGRLRVFPRGARWDAPACFDEQDDWSGDHPPGLNLNRGPGVTSAAPDRDAAIAALLTVHGADGGPADDRWGMPDSEVQAGLAWSGGLAGSGGGGGLESGLRASVAGVGGGRRHYEEWRLAPGDVVTIVGSAVPFRDIDDPAMADRDDPLLALDDPEVAMNVAEARRAGLLVGSPEEAWGNAAIPGFGIGRPTRAPDLDPAAPSLPIAPAGVEAAVDATFDIPPGELVVAAVPGSPLIIRAGSPGEAVARDRGSLTLGLVGAVIAIAAALALALVAQGTFG
jgi:hypothetical protein